MHLPVPRFRPVPGLPRPLTRPITTIGELAALIRARVAESLWGRVEPAPAPDTAPDIVVVAAAAPFAPTAFARARLLRQMHASGLLSDRETERAQLLLGVAQSG